MIDTIGRANMDYMVRLANEPDWAAAELKALNDMVASHGAVYGGKPVPVPIKPHFISPAQRTLLQTGVSRVHSALERFIEHWLHDERLQKAWGVTDAELELYKVDPGYSQAIQIARFDAFLSDDDLKFLEFNCDSPGGTGYADVIHRSFMDMFARNELAGPFHINDRKRLLHLSDTLKACYDEWRKRGHSHHPEKPFVVVTDWRDVGTMPDINITIRHLQECGLEAAFADPRDFVLKDDGLYVAAIDATDGNILQERRVDMIYKRVIVNELVNETAAQDLVEGYKQGKVCLVNSPRAVIVGNKKILAALRLPSVMAKLSAVERAAVRDFVPWTEILRDAKVEFQGFKVDLRTFVMDNKDKLVLKAAQSYGGRDVFLGFETDEKKWQNLLDLHLNDNAWIVQQFVTIPKELYPEVGPDGVHMKLLNVNINPLAFGGNYSGAYSRLSRKNVINVSFGGGMTATMTLEPLES